MLCISLHGPFRKPWMISYDYHALVVRSQVEYKKKGANGQNMHLNPSINAAALLLPYSLKCAPLISPWTNLSSSLHPIFWTIFSFTLEWLLVVIKAVFGLLIRRRQDFPLQMAFQFICHRCLLMLASKSRMSKKRRGPIDYQLNEWRCKRMASLKSIPWKVHLDSCFFSSPPFLRWKTPEMKLLE